MPSPDNSDKSKENELALREAALRERELTVQLKQMEVELARAKGDRLAKDQRHSPDTRWGRIRRWRRNATEGIKLFAIVVAVLVAIRLAHWLASIILVLAVSYLVYKLYFAGRFNQD